MPDGYFTVKKLNGKLEFKVHNTGYETRNESVMNLIKWCDEKYNLPDFNPIIIGTADSKQQQLKEIQYTFSSKSGENTIPDFNFDHWRQVKLFNYKKVTEELNNIDLNKYEELKVGWIGSCRTSRIRTKVLMYGQRFPKMFDIKDSGSWIKNNKKKTDVLIAKNRNFMSIKELAEKYAILIDIEGYGYSGRLKYLFHTGRPVIIVDRPYKEFFFDKLEAYVHYIPVERNLRDLMSKVDWTIRNYDRAKKIGLNGKYFAQEYLTRDSALKFYKEIFEKHKINEDKEI